MKFCTVYMLAVRISIKKTPTSSIRELSRIMAKDIAYFTKYLIIYMFRSIQSLMTVLQMEFFLKIDLKANPRMVLKNNQLLLQK